MIQENAQNEKLKRKPVPENLAALWNPMIFSCQIYVKRNCRYLTILKGESKEENHPLKCLYACNI